MSILLNHSDLYFYYIYTEEYPEVEPEAEPEAEIEEPFDCRSYMASCFSDPSQMKDCQ